MLAGLACLVAPGVAAAKRGGILKDPIDRRQQTALRFGDRSHWLQPWRGYLETVPAARLRNAVGINFNVRAEEAAPTARLLARSGFRRARVEFGWDSMAFDQPSRLNAHAREKMKVFLAPLRDHGIRPLLLLNPNHNVPGPARFFDVRLAAPARAGSRSVRLERASARAVVPHLSGLDMPGGRAAEILFTSVGSEGVATLSKPLARDLGAGPHPAVTLRYAPFGPPELSGGRRNPAFERTLHGWLQYVGAVTREARSILGSDKFDVEVWNELSFGSDFLFQERYYDPPRERGEGDVARELLERTVAFVRDPRNSVSGIGIGDGFANQRPWESGATSPRGLTAIDKHPYYGLKRFPRDAVVNGIAPLDARGHGSYKETPVPGAAPIRRDRFIPATTRSSPSTSSAESRRRT